MSSNEKNQKGVIGIYQYLDDFCQAIDEIEKRSDCDGHEIYSYTSYHELMDRAERRWGPSQVRWFTLTGALSGIIAGFGMCLLLDYDWPIVVGGKTPGIYSLPAYVIFGFELMVLIGAIMTIAGMLVMGRIPKPTARIIDKRLTDDFFAICCFR